MTGQATPSFTLVERLSNEADLCRNEGADDIAELLDEAVEALAVRRVAPEVAADVDAKLGLIELPPIRMGSSTVANLSDQAHTAGLVLQAYVRSLLTIASIAPMSKAVHDVLAERLRQINFKGWTPEHDDEHDQGELAGGAAAYAAHASDALHPMSQGDAFRDGTLPPGWCWEPDSFKPGDPYRNLEKAAAMILAEMERMLRLGVSVARVEEPLPHFDEVGSDEFETWFKDFDERDSGLPAPSPRERSRWLGYVGRHAIALAAWRESRAPFDDALVVYHHALDTRQHGGVAASNLIDSVEGALGKPWVQGATLATAAAPVEG